MNHTTSTLRNFAGLAVTDFLIGLVVVGFGAVDLIMIAPKGTRHVAAVGQADLIVVGLFAFFGGLVDIFASRLAQAEGAGQTMQRLRTLTAAMLLALMAAGILGAILGLLARPFLDLAQQNAALTPYISDYVSLRLFSVPMFLAYAAGTVACRICGLKNVALVVMCGGLAANAVLNWLFLYTPVQDVFVSPEQAVAAATLGAQAAMMVSTLTAFGLQIRKREEPLAPAGHVRGEFVSMVGAAPGVGVRHLNDYMGAIVPLMFVGTMSVTAVAAYAVAAKIYTIFCRVPQACVSSAFVYYGYEVGREQDPSGLRRSAYQLVKWVAVPTAVATVVVAGTAPWLIDVFGGSDADARLTGMMLLAFMITVPLYIFEAAYGEILTVHQRSGLLSVASTLTTWLLMIPLAAFGVFVLNSAPLAIGLGAGVSTLVLVAVFRRALHEDHWSAGADRLTQA